MRRFGNPPDSKSTDRNWTEPVEKVLQRLHGTGHVQIMLDPTSLPPTVEDAPRGCDHCKHSGWIVVEWTPGVLSHTNAGAVPCQYCKAPALRQKAIDRIFGEAGAPREYEDATFESYARLPIHEKHYELPDGTKVPGTQVQALEKARAFAAADKGSILFYGEQMGVGKTALAVCTAREIVNRTACSFVFITTIRLFERIRSTFGPQSPLRSDEVLNAVLNADLLVLDDLGREYRKPGDAGLWVVERMFDIVDWRHTQHLRTIYTSNKTIPELATHLDAAVAWRIKDHCDDPNLVKVQGMNFRDMSRAEREKVLA